MSHDTLHASITHPFEQVLACKVIRFRDGVVSQEDAEREYNILSRLRHPNIVKYVDYSWKLDKAKLYMEYCSEGSLQDFIMKSQKYDCSVRVTKHLLIHCSRIGPAIPEVVIWSVLAQLASALVYCHYGVHTSGNGGVPPADRDPVLHRDIKPANGNTLNVVREVGLADTDSAHKQQYSRDCICQAWGLWLIDDHG